MKMWIDKKPTVTLPLKYKCRVIEDVTDLSMWMSVRTQYFVFRIDQWNWEEVVADDTIKHIQIQIPSFEQHDELRQTDAKYMHLMKNHLLHRIETTITSHVLTELTVSGIKDNYPNWKFDFREVPNDE